MANSAQAKKRARQNIKRHAHKKAQRSELRTKIKQVLHAVKEGNKDLMASSLKAVASGLDKMASKGIIHKNKASRLKSRLNKKVKAAA